MKNNWTIELNGELQLRLEYLAHLRRNLTRLKTIKADLADTEPRIGLKRRPQPRQQSTAFDSRRLPQAFPRMHPDEVPADQEFPDRRISSRHMTMRISQPSKPPKPNQI